MTAEAAGGAGSVAPLEISCEVYSHLLLLYPDDLYFRYGEEMQWVFREELREAAKGGAAGYARFWCGVLRDTAQQLGGAAALRLSILGAATLGALTLMLVPAMFVRPIRFPLPVAASSKATPAAEHHLLVERTVLVAPGVRVQVLDWGGAGRPLLFLAGLGSDAHVYDGFAPQFTSGYHVYAMTRRGFGASDKPAPTPENYAADRLGDDVLAVLSGLHLEHAVLVGHSIAGEELSSVGSRHPERVAGLVYLDAGDGYGLYDARHGDWQIDMNEVRRRVDAIAAGVPLNEGVLRDLRQSAQRLERSTGDVEQQFASMPRELPPPPPMPAVALAVRFGEAKYTRVGAPTLAIFACPHGSGPMPGGDALARKREEASDARRCTTQAEAFQAAIPQATVLRIPHADHFVFVSNAQQVAAAMRAFLDRLPQR